ncbi:zinc-binding dehydrogenase [Ruania halotolerans]|uniref:zinc-binding dehydrogenase n=1 Tax=Ruania halotolerans TaxID=2897773 RepID=UPI001E5FDFF6|nr:zinc-binding dehydrogenase [Ruania halotolerans]UFU06495.1 zinc-binding dehydrogenase [Ruania halotolerans]
MRAVRIHGQGDMRIEELPALESVPGQVRIRPTYVGICGSDLHYFSDGAAGIFRIVDPLIPGHEMSGTVEADPSGRLSPGTPVTVHPSTWGPPSDGPRHTWPGGTFLGSASTSPHTQGAMAESLVVTADQVRPLPAGLSLRTAVLVEPLAVALHALAMGGRGSRVLISGSGPIGLLTAAAALAHGAEEVWCADVRSGPLERAVSLGVHQTINVSQTMLPESAFDVVYECAGLPQTLHALLSACRRGGTLVQVGNVPNEDRPVNLAPIVSKEIALRGVFRYDTEIDDAIAMLADNPEIESVITHEFSLDEVNQAFATAADSEASGKVIVRVSE